MKKLSLVILVAVLSIAFVACGDSKDLHKSQKSTQDLQVESSVDSRESRTINTSDSQSKSNESDADSSIESNANPQDSNKSNNEATHALIPNPNDLQNATFTEKSAVALSASFIGDDIAKYSGGLYGGRTFWGKTFVKNLKDCNDIKNADTYMAFSDAKDRIMKLKHSSYPAERVYKISFMRVEWHDNSVVVRFSAMESQNYQGNDLEYYQSRYPFGDFDYDRYQDLYSSKDVIYTSFTEDDDEDDYHPFEIYICPTNKP